MWAIRTKFLFIGFTVLSALLISCVLFKDKHQEFHPSTLELPHESRINVLLLGGSGAVGQELIKVLAEEDRVKTVTLLLRKQLGLENITSNYKKFSQKVIDFDKLKSSDFSMQNGLSYDVCTIALGTTRAKSGLDGFYTVDHDYIVNTAKLARVNRCKHFNLVSSVGANKNSWFTYPKVKGQVEEEITNLQFPRTSIYRPAVLLTASRPDFRPAETVAQNILRYLDVWNIFSVEASIVAKSIVKNALLVANESIEVLENKDILQLVN